MFLDASLIAHLFLSNSLSNCSDSDSSDSIESEDSA